MSKLQVWLISRDLMTSSRVTSVARRCDVAAQVVSGPERLPDDCDDAAWILIDLDSVGTAPLAKLEPCASWSTAPRLIAFGPHVKTDLLQAAHDAGCHEVWTRGQMEGRLEQELQAS